MNRLTDGRMPSCARKGRAIDHGSGPLLGVLWLAALPLPQDRVGGDLVNKWYVDASAPSCPGGAGTPSDPFCRIVDAMATASAGDTIYVAPGRYPENLFIDKDLTLIGTGGSQVTILDGSGSGCVVEVRGRFRYTRVALVGLTLTNGTGAVPADWSAGGGLFVQSNAGATLSGCRVVGNSATFGGGIAAGPGGGVRAIDTTIESNQAYMGGGAATVSCPGSIVCGSGAVGILRSRVSDNTASAGGGGIYSYGWFTGVYNSIVSGNTAPTAAIEIEGSGLLELWNSTVARNSGVGILAVADLDVRNSILWGNALGSFDLPTYPLVPRVVAHSLVEGGWTGAGTGNLDVDPLFLDPLNGDFRLQSGSPCIDAGDSSAVPVHPGLTTDLRGVPRFIDDPLTPDSGVGPAPVVDMGAYEFFRRFRDTQGVPVPPTATSLP